jgi:hypothetical protein
MIFDLLAAVGEELLCIGLLLDKVLVVVAG